MKTKKNKKPKVRVKESFLTRCGLPQMLLLRIFTAFFTISCIMTFVLDKKEIYSIPSSKEYMQNINLITVLILCAVVVGVMTLFYYYLPKRFRGFDPVCTVISVLLFDFKALFMLKDAYATIGTAIVSLVIIAYALSKFNLQDVMDKGKWWVYGIIVLVAGVSMIVCVSVCSISRHYLFFTGAVDFGLFVQSFHSLAENLTAVNSCERDVLMSHFNIHSSYIFYLFVPIFKIFPHEETLLILQAIFAMGGIVPLMLILKERNFKGLSMFFMGLAYVFSISFIMPCFYDFHENAFLPTLLMWTLWATDTKRYIPFYIFSVLVCLVKEDAPLYIICIGMYAFFECKGDKKRFHGLIMAFVSCVYMLLITSWLVKHGDGAQMTYWRFGHLLQSKDQGMVDVLINSLKNPGYLFSTFVTEATLPFLFQVMMPLLFLPFFTKKIHRFLLMLPFVITNLVVGAYYQYAGNIGYQYIFGPAALLVFMTVINVDDMSDSLRRNIPVLAFAASFIFFSGFGTYMAYYYFNYTNKSAYYNYSEQILQSIPEDAVIGGDSQLVSHLCDRKEIYIFDINDITHDKTALIHPGRYDFVVLKNNSEVQRYADPLLLKDGYTRWDTTGANCVIYEHPRYSNP